MAPNKNAKNIFFSELRFCHKEEKTYTTLIILNFRVACIFLKMYKMKSWRPKKILLVDDDEMHAPFIAVN